MTKVTVLSQTGASVGEIELNDAIFGIEPNEAVLFDAVIAQRASLRQGNIKLKIALKFLVVVVNHGVKKELAVLVKDLSALHNGVVVVQYSDQHQEAIAINYLKKFVA